MGLAYIDEHVFTPLANYLASAPFDPSRLERSVQQIGLPERNLVDPGHFKGFALEVYFKVTLAGFMQEKCRNLNGILLEDGHYRGLRVKTDSWGTVTAYTVKGDSTAELDTLCEYQAGKENIPILFETTFNGSGGGLWSHKRPFLARILNGKNAYLCKIRPAKTGESTTLHVNGKDLRKILTPHAAEIEKFGQRMFARYAEAKQKSA